MVGKIFLFSDKRLHIMSDKKKKIISVTLTASDLTALIFLKYHTDFHINITITT